MFRLRQELHVTNLLTNLVFEVHNPNPTPSSSFSASMSECGFCLDGCVKETLTLALTLVLTVT